MKPPSGPVCGKHPTYRGGAYPPVGCKVCKTLREWVLGPRQ